MHAAAALCAVKDGRLILQLQPDVVSRLISALQGLDGSHDQVNVHAVLDEILASRGICLVNYRMRGNSRCDALICLALQGAEFPGPPGQDSLQNLQSLYPLKEQLHATLQHIEELLEST